MILRSWAAKWGIPFAAIQDLEQQIGINVREATVNAAEAGSESRQQSLIRMEAPRYRMQLFRNNVGGQGRLRWGLANDSEKQNKLLKSADLIGWTTVTVTPDMIGQDVAIFTSIECKEEDWSFGKDIEREEAQLNWLELVVAGGGKAMFATRPGDLMQIALPWGGVAYVPTPR
jgi:hypothetical protein